MFFRHQAALLVALLSALAAPASQAGLIDSLFGSGNENARIEQWAAKPDKPLQWGEWDQISLERHAGSPNAQPVKLSTEQVAAALASIQIQVYRQVKPLFSEQEVRRFSLAISLALAKAGADRDIVFISTGEHESGLTSPTLANAGRIFFADGRLNVLMGMTHYDFLVDLRRGSQQPPRFATGSREAAAADVKIMSAGKYDGKLLRSDWIAIAPPKIETKAPALKIVPVAGKPANQAVPTAVRAPVAAPIAADNDEAFYGKQEARLRVLQRMYQQGLIDEAELKAKRNAILGDL